jgi:hypothetical protein
MCLYHSVTRHADCLRCCSHRLYITALQTWAICMATSPFFIAAVCITASAPH